MMSKIDIAKKNMKHNLKIIKDKLELYLTTRQKHEQDGYYKGFREGLGLAVELMLNTSYIDLDKDFITLIDRILEN